jgi:hypothetical protein
MTRVTISRFIIIIAKEKSVEMEKKLFLKKRKLFFKCEQKNLETLPKYAGRKNILL